MKRGTSNRELVKLMGLGGDFDFDVSPVTDASHTPPPENSQQLLLTTEQAGHALQIGRSHLYTILARGEIKSIKIGGSRRIPMTELERYIEGEMEDDEEI